jgi:hypothetical protein
MALAERELRRPSSTGFGGRLVTGSAATALETIGEAAFLPEQCGPPSFDQFGRIPVVGMEIRPVVVT